METETGIIVKPRWQQFQQSKADGWCIGDAECRVAEGWCLLCQVQQSALSVECAYSPPLLSWDAKERLVECQLVDAEADAEEATGIINVRNNRAKIHAPVGPLDEYNWKGCNSRNCKQRWICAMFSCLVLHDDWLDTDWTGRQMHQ